MGSDQASIPASSAANSLSLWAIASACLAMNS